MLRGLLKIVAVIIAVGAIGTGVGIALAEMTGHSPTPVPVSTGPAPRAAPPSTPTATATTPPRIVLARVRVLSAVLYPAATAGGRARQRARVSIRVRVTNRATDTLAPGDPALLLGPDRVSPDPAAARFAGALLKPLQPGATANGELRFETAGVVTQRLTSQLRARLRIAHRTVALRLTIRPTASPSG